MGEGRENNCIWQKNLPSGQQGGLGSQSLASDCACHWQCGGGRVILSPESIWVSTSVGGDSST